MTWDNRFQDKQPCPSCGHYNVLIVDLGEMNEMNKAAVSLFQNAQREHDMLTEDQKRQNKKVRLAGTVWDHLACMCVVLHCSNRHDGAGCHLCERYIAAKNGMSLLGEQGNCTCATCQCRCAVRFRHNERAKVASETTFNLPAVNTTLPQSSKSPHSV